MPISLYDASVTVYLQTLGAASRFLERAATHCRDNQTELAEIVETRLFPDMLPFRFQVQSIVAHSVGTIEAIKAGTFKPSGHDTRHDYASLQTLVQEARQSLEKETPEDINAREGAEVIFQAGEHVLRFSAVNFVSSFSLPNFHFHATTAYDILRSRGVPLGKRDYLGKLRFNR
jgi:uncharacterized protein